MYFPVKSALSENQANEGKLAKVILNNWGQNLASAVRKQSKKNSNLMFCLIFLH